MKHRITTTQRWGNLVSGGVDGCRQRKMHCPQKKVCLVRNGSPLVHSSWQLAWRADKKSTHEITVRLRSEDGIQSTQHTSTLCLNSKHCRSLCVCTRQLAFMLLLVVCVCSVGAWLHGLHWQMVTTVHTQDRLPWATFGGKMRARHSGAFEQLLSEPHAQR